jgi:hypothetical protein
MKTMRRVLLALLVALVPTVGMAAPTSWFTVNATGNATADAAALQNAVNNHPAVWATGAFNLGSTPLTVPASVDLEGPNSYGNPASGGFSSSALITTIVGSGITTGMVQLSSYDVLRGIAVIGNRLGSGSEDCIWAKNAISVKIEQVQVINCSHNGIVRDSSSSSTPSQLAWINHDFCYQPGGNYACVHEGFSSTGFVTDEIIADNDFTLCGSIGCIYMATGPFSVSQIINNRLEDSPACVINLLSGYVNISGNIVDKAPALCITNNVAEVTVTGNTFDGTDWNDFAGSKFNIEFSGTSTDIRMSGNVILAGNGGANGQYMFKADTSSGCTNCTIDPIYASAGTAVFADANSSNTLLPAMANAAGGTLLLKTVSASGAASIQFTALPTAFNTLEYNCSGLTISVADAVYFQVGEGAGPTWETTGHYTVQAYGMFHGQGSSPFTVDSLTATDMIDNGGNVNGSLSLKGSIDDVSSSSLSKPVTFMLSNANGATQADRESFVSYWNSDTNPITGLQIIPKTNTTTISGTCSLYGEN